MNKIHKCIYTERDEIWKSSRKKLWKFQVNKTNVGIVFVAKYIFMKHQILDFWNFIGIIEVCVHFFIFAVKKKLLKNYQICSFCPRHFQSLVLYFSLFFFSFLGHCSIYRRRWLMINTKVYCISMSLNLILKTLII